MLEIYSPPCPGRANKRIKHSRARREPEESPAGTYTHLMWAVAAIVATIIETSTATGTGMGSAITTTMRSPLG